MHFQNYDSALTVLNELNARVSNIEEVTVFSLWLCVLRFLRRAFVCLHIHDCIFISMCSTHESMASIYLVASRQVLLRLGMLHLLKGEHKQAMTHLKRVVELNDKNYFAWIGIAEVHQMRTLLLCLPNTCLS